MHIDDVHASGDSHGYILRNKMYMSGNVSQTALMRVTIINTMLAMKGNGPPAQSCFYQDVRNTSTVIEDSYHRNQTPAHARNIVQS